MSANKVTMEIGFEASHPAVVNEESGLSQWQEVGLRLAHAYESAGESEVDADDIDIAQWDDICHRMTSRKIWEVDSDSSSVCEESECETDCASDVSSAFLEDDELDVSQWGDVGARLASSQIWDMRSETDAISDSESEFLKDEPEHDSTSAGNSSDGDLDSLSGDSVDGIFTASAVLTLWAGLVQGLMRHGEKERIVAKPEDTLVRKPSSSDFDAIEEVDVSQWGDVCNRIAAAHIWDAISDSGSDSEYVKGMSDQDSMSASDSSDWEVESLSAMSLP